MTKDERWRPLIIGAWFFACYLFCGIFSDALWKFAATQAAQWWHHGGIFKLVFGFVCTAIFVCWWQRRGAFKRSQSTSQIVPER